ncbi:MAG: hypothetical protein HDQ88_05290 [Clostridia bacterium]|nr:hypothetical protein [Clostridia bacterium]
MRKKRIISGVVATAIAVSVTASGCSLVSTNPAADMNQSIAVIDISKTAKFDSSLDAYKKAVGETSIIKRELVAYFINVGYSYVQSGSSYEDVFTMLLDSLVDNAVMVQYSTMYLLKDKAENSANEHYDASALETYMSLDSEVKKYEYLLDGTTDGKGTGNEAKIAKYSLYKSINSAIDNYESNILDEDESTNGTDSRAVPDGIDTEKEDYYPKKAGSEDLDYGIYTGYDGYHLENSGTYEKDKLEGTRVETRIKAYNRFISSLASSSYDLVDKKTENLRDVLSLRYIEDEYISQLEQRIITKYYDVYEEEQEKLLLNADGNYGFVAGEYESFLDSQREDYASDSSFTSAMGSMSDSSFILYAPDTEEDENGEKGRYGFVYNILLPFNNAQSDALKELQTENQDSKLDGGYKPEYYTERAKLLKDIKTTDQRSAWFNGETDYSFKVTGDSALDYYGKTAETDAWLFFENNVANSDRYEKLDKYAGLYPYNGKVIERADDYLLIPNSLDIEGMLTEFENYIEHVSGCSLEKGTVNYTGNYTDETLYGKEVDGKKKIDYSNFVYAKGKVNFGNASEAVTRANLLISEEGKESKEYKALSAVNELQYAYTTDVGVLSNYLGYTVEAGDTSYIKEFEYASHEAIKSGAGSYAVCAGDYGWHLIYVTYTFDIGEQYSPVWSDENVKTEGTFENLFYEWVKSRNLSDISSTRRKQVLNTYKSDDTVTKYQNRYQNLLDLDK